MAGVYAATLLFLVISTCSKGALSLYSSDLYSLDGGEVALTLPRGDDIIESISLSNPSFFFFGSNYSDLHVSTNGQISVDTPEENFVPREFPTDKIIIAPFWADVDTREGGGEIVYGVTRNTSQLDRAEQQIAAAFPEVSFVPAYLFIATWTDVGYYNRLTFNNNRSLLNTFQCVLATDGLYSFIMFLYPKGGIQWTAGDTHGRNGRQFSGDLAAIAGFNFNDTRGGVMRPVKFATLPHSGTDDIARLMLTSDVGHPGLWIFRVDENELGTPEPVPEPTTPMTDTALITPASTIAASSPTATTSTRAVSPVLGPTKLVMPTGTMSVSATSSPTATTSTLTTDATSQGSGIDMGALAGTMIAVIIVISILILGCVVIIGFILWRRRKRAKYGRV